MTYIPPIACWGFDDATLAESYSNSAGNQVGRYSGRSRGLSGLNGTYSLELGSVADLNVRGGILGLARSQPSALNTGSSAGLLGLRLSSGGNPLVVGVIDGRIGAWWSDGVNIGRNLPPSSTHSRVLARSSSVLERLPAGGMWMHLEVRFSFPADVLEVRLNGQHVLTYSGTEPLGSEDTVLSGVYFSHLAVQGNTLHDDMYLVKDDTGVTADWLGDLRVITQVPGGPGSSNDWTPSTGGDPVDNWSLVNEANTNAAAQASNVFTTVPGDRDLYAPAPVDGEWEVLGTTIELASRKDVSGNAPNIRAVQKQGSDVWVGPMRPPNNASWAKIGAELQPVAPDGLNWTLEKLNETEFGIESV